MIKVILRGGVGFGVHAKYVVRVYTDDVPSYVDLVSIQWASDLTKFNKIWSALPSTASVWQYDVEG